MMSSSLSQGSYPCHCLRCRWWHGPWQVGGKEWYRSDQFLVQHHCVLLAWHLDDGNCCMYRAPKSFSYKWLLVLGLVSLSYIWRPALGQMVYPWHCVQYKPCNGPYQEGYEWMSIGSPTTTSTPNQTNPWSMIIVSFLTYYLEHGNYSFGWMDMM